MSLKFQPGIYRDETFHALPGPVTRLQIQDHWDFDRFKVLLDAGDHTVGLSRKGVDVAVTGQVAQQGGALLLSEADMFAAIEELRELLESQAGALFDFYLYRDAATLTCRYFKQCSVSRFQYELSEPELYTYALTLHADDPVIYADWPEELTV